MVIDWAADEDAGLPCINSPQAEFGASECPDVAHEGEELNIKINIIISYFNLIYFFILLKD